jgi:hypothetical protein
MKPLNPKTIRPAVKAICKASGLNRVQIDAQLKIVSNLIRRYNNAILELELIEKSVNCYEWKKVFK